MNSSQKALSWLDSGSGGALVPPPKQGKYPKARKRKLSPPKAKASSFKRSTRKQTKKPKKS